METSLYPLVVCHTCKIKTHRTFKHICFLPTRKPKPKKPKELKLPTRNNQN